MNQDPLCTKCGSPLVEKRVRFTADGKTQLDEAGPWWKTKCVKCGRFVGYRPATEKAGKRLAEKPEPQGSFANQEEEET